MKRRFILAFTVVAVILSVWQTTVCAQEMVHALWQHETAEDITYLRLLDDSLILTGTKSGIECLNSSKGYVLWRTTVEDSAMGWRIGHINETPYLLMLRSRGKVLRASRFRGGGQTMLMSNSLKVMNIHTGAVLWDSKSTDIYSIVGYYPTPDSTKLILITVDSSRARSMRCIDFQAKEQLWEINPVNSMQGFELTYLPSLDSLSLGQQQPVFDTDSTMITFFTKGLVRKWNWLTGAVIWETKLHDEELARLSKGHMQMRLNSKGTGLFVPMLDRLIFVDKQTGEILWESPEMKGIVSQVEETQYGLLVEGAHFKSNRRRHRDYMILIDPETGEFKWKKQITKFKTSRTSNFVTFDDLAYIYSDRRMYEISIPTGSYREIGEKLDVSGNIRLSKVDNQIQLNSGETVALVDTDATVVFNSTYKPLGSGGGLFSTIRTIVSVAVVASAIAQVGSGSDWSGGFIYVPRVSYGLTRFSSSAVASDSSICMVTNVRHGSQKRPGIIRVRFSDGEVVNSGFIYEDYVYYTFSEALSVLYIIEGTSRITAFRF